MNKANNIFEYTDCISEEKLTKYVSGKLPPAEKHEVEKHLIDCEMCSDAAEGLTLISDKKKISSVTSELNQKINNRAEKKEAKIIFFYQYRTQLAVAAAIILILGLVWFFRTNMQMKELDNATAEKMFADKFEPPPAENKSEEIVSSSDREDVDNITQPPLSENKEDIVSAKKQDKVFVREPGEANANIQAKEKTMSTKSGMQTRDEFKIQEEDAFAKESSKKQNQSERIEKNKMETEKPVAAPSMTSSGAASAAYISSAQAEGKDMNQESESASSDKKKRGKYSKRNTKAVSAYDDAVPAASSPQPSSQPEQSAKNIMLDSVSSGITNSGDISLNESSTIAEGAMLKYNKQDYAGAILDFEQILKNNPSDEKSLFYSAVSCLSIGQADKAIINFNKILQNKNSKYYDDAQWYLSLAYIKKKDADNARINLTELKNNSYSKYQKQAAQTLEEMNKK